jgi:hypothetical protein
MDIAMTWVFGTGNSISLPSAEYPSSNWTPGGSQFHGGGFGDYSYNIQYYGAKNSYRMAAYHRLDIGINFVKEKKWGVRTWSFGLYNAYNRKNPFFLYQGYTNSGLKTFKQVSLFPVIPSITYSFKF